MLKKRVAATLVVKEGLVVQSIGFRHYRPVGKPEIAIKFFDDWGIDEIILLDISSTKRRRPPDYAMVRNGASRCHVPLTVGGGIKCIEHISELMSCGADKVALNQAALCQPSLLEKAAKIFGSQCLVGSIDALRVGNKYCVYDYLQGQALQISVREFARQLQEQGAGEILINSVDRDGTQSGFDLELINNVCGAVNLPVICCGGAGNPKHFLNALENTHASAIAASNFFHFTEHSVTITKAILGRTMSIRHETIVSYQNNHFDRFGRLQKKDEAELEELMYQKIEKEII